jgi:hypothetical protein
VPSVISVPLAALFVFLAGFNVWIMLTNRGASPRSRRLWTRAHRISGHTFIALVAVFYYFMLLRVKGSLDELSPRLILHMGLAFLLAPLLLVKVIAVRYQKAAWNLLMALGIGIFGIAFALVALNVSVHYLRIASRHKVTVGTSEAVIVVVLALAVMGYFSGIKYSGAKSDTVESRPTTGVTKPPQSRTAFQEKSKT